MSFNHSGDTTFFVIFKNGARIAQAGSYIDLKLKTGLDLNKLVDIVDSGKEIESGKYSGCTISKCMV